MTFVKGQMFTEEHRRRLRENHRGMSGRHLSKEQKDNLRRTKLGRQNPMFGKEPWNKGQAHLVNEANPAWKGDDVNRPSIHAWVRNHFVKTGICEKCKRSKKTEWSNKDHKYNSRKRTAWQELCRKCHLLYDYKFLGRTRTRTPSQQYNTESISR